MTEPIEPTPVDSSAVRLADVELDWTPVFGADDAARVTPVAEPTEPDDVVDEDPGDDDAVLDPKMRAHLHKLREEARAQRRRALAAEADRERLITQLAAAQHADVERHAEPLLVDRTDIWRAQSDMGAFLDEYGAVDQVKVAEAAQQLVADKPHLARPSQAPPPTDRPIEGLRPGAAPEVTPSTPTWQSFIRGHSGQHR